MEPTLFATVTSSVSPGPFIAAAVTSTDFWKTVGWVGNAVFFSRFLVQWYATEKRREVVVPSAFWWLSLSGALLLLLYAIHRNDAVFIFAYAFTWIPYVRNLWIHHQHQRAHIPCPECQALSAPSARFCAQCGTALPVNRSAA
jgi:lipid-A-disaccharide synthase-like uncharacterized protein